MALLESSYGQLRNRGMIAHERFCPAHFVFLRHWAKCFCPDADSGGSSCSRLSATSPKLINEATWRGSRKG